jgi:hypothetical protein
MHCIVPGLLLVGVMVYKVCVAGLVMYVWMYSCSGAQAPFVWQHTDHAAQEPAGAAATTLTTGDASAAANSAAAGQCCS